MKKETFKEVGKYLFDISKILIAIAIVTPLAKDEPFSWIVALLATALALLATFITNKGAKDD